MLDAGEVQSDLASRPGVHPDALVGFQAPSEEEIDQMLHPPLLPGLLPCRAGQNYGRPRSPRVLTPIIRREIRAALRAEARRQAREPKA